MKPVTKHTKKAMACGKAGKDVVIIDGVEMGKERFPLSEQIRDPLLLDELERVVTTPGYRFLRLECGGIIHHC